MANETTGAMHIQIEPEQARTKAWHHLDSSEGFVMVALVEDEQGEAGIELYSDLCKVNVALLLQKATEALMGKPLKPATNE
jgi:hypothetical protein